MDRGRFRVLLLEVVEEDVVVVVGGSPVVVVVEIPIGLTPAMAGANTGSDAGSIKDVAHSGGGGPPMVSVS